MSPDGPKNKFYRRTGQINRALSFTTKVGQTAAISSQNSRAMRRAADCGQRREAAGAFIAIVRKRRDYGGVVTKTIM